MTSQFIDLINNSYCDISLWSHQDTSRVFLSSLIVQRFTLHIKSYFICLMFFLFLLICQKTQKKECAMHYGLSYDRSWVRSSAYTRVYHANIPYMSRPSRKPKFRPSKKTKVSTLRKVSTRISISMPRKLTRTDTVRLLRVFCFRNHYSIPLRRNVSTLISLRGLRRLIQGDTLRRDHNVSFLVERLICGG